MNKEEIKRYLNNRYPNIEINNEYLELTREHISYFGHDGHIKDDAKYNYGR